MASNAISKDDVISRLEFRYDFQSARNIFKEWLKAGGQDDKASLSADDIKGLVAYMEANDKHTGKAKAALHKLAGIEDASAQAAPAAPAAEPTPAADQGGGGGGDNGGGGDGGGDGGGGDGGE